MALNFTPKRIKYKDDHVSPTSDIAHGRTISDVSTGRQVIQGRLKLGSRDSGGSIGSGNAINKMTKALDRAEQKHGSGESENYASSIGVHTYNSSLVADQLRKRMQASHDNVVNKAFKPKEQKQTHSEPPQGAPAPPPPQNNQQKNKKYLPVVNFKNKFSPFFNRNK